MSPADLQLIRAAVRDVPDFPKPGIVFKDITPVLSDGRLFKLVVTWLAEAAHAHQPDKIVGIDARGFIFGAAVASQLGLGFVPIRKKGKLPFRCEAAAYALEYGEAIVEMHVDAVQPGERVVLVDDLLATGGTAGAALKLLQHFGGEVAAAIFFLELGFLPGRTLLGRTPVVAFLTY